MILNNKEQRSPRCTFAQWHQFPCLSISEVNFSLDPTTWQYFVSSPSCKCNAYYEAFQNTYNLLHGWSGLKLINSQSGNCKVFSIRRVLSRLLNPIIWNITLLWIYRTVDKHYFHILFTPKAWFDHLQRQSNTRVLLKSSPLYIEYYLILFETSRAMQ